MAEKPTPADLVDIFDAAEPAMVGTVEEQLEFHRRWINVLKGEQSVENPLPGEVEESRSEEAGAGPGAVPHDLKSPLAQGIKDIVCWTERGSRIHGFATELGFRRIHDAGYGTVIASDRLPTIMKIMNQYLEMAAGRSEGRERQGRAGRSAVTGA